MWREKEEWRRGGGMERERGEGEKREGGKALVGCGQTSGMRRKELEDVS